MWVLVSATGRGEVWFGGRAHRVKYLLIVLDKQGRVL